MASSDQSAYASLVSRIHHHLATVLSHSKQINEVVPRSPALSNSSASSFADQQQQQQSTSNSVHPSSLQPPSLASASLPIFLSNLVHQSHAYAVSLASALEGIQGIDLTLRVSSTAANLVAALMVSLAAIEDEEDGVWRAVLDAAKGTATSNSTVIVTNTPSKISSFLRWFRVQTVFLGWWRLWCWWSHATAAASAIAEASSSSSTNVASSSGKPHAAWKAVAAGFGAGTDRRKVALKFLRFCMILSSTRHIIRIIYGIKQGLSLVPNVTETTPVTTQLPDHLLPLADSDVTPFSPFPQSSRPSRMPSSRVSTSTHTRSTSTVAPVTPVAKEYRRSTLSDMINQDATEDIAKQSEEKDIEAGSSQDGGSTGDESAAAGESGDELEVVQQQRQRRQERKRRALKSGDEENDDEEDARARQRSSNRKEMRGGTRSASRRRRPMSIDRAKRTDEDSAPVPLGSSLSSSVKASATLDLSASFTESDFKLPSLSATSDSTKSINYPTPLPLLPHSDSISSFTSKQSRKTTPPPPPPQPTSPDDPTHIDPLTTALKTWRTLLHIFIHTPLTLTYILAKSRILSFTPPPRLQAHTSTAAYTLQRTRTLRRWTAVVWCLVISADAAVWARKVWRIVKALVVVRRQVQLAGRGSGRRVSSVGMGGGDGGVYGVEEFLADVVGGRGVAGLSQLMQSLRRGGGNVGGEAGGGQSLEVKMLVSEMEGLKREVRKAGLALLAVVGDFPAAFGGCFLGSANLAGREGLVALAGLANDYEGRQAVDEVAIRSGVFPLWFTALGAFAASLAAWRLRAKDGVVVDSL